MKLIMTTSFSDQIRDRNFFDYSFKINNEGKTVTIYFFIQRTLWYSVQKSF